MIDPHTPHGHLLGAIKALRDAAASVGTVNQAYPIGSQLREAERFIRLANREIDEARAKDAKIRRNKLEVLK